MKQNEQRTIKLYAISTGKYKRQPAYLLYAEIAILYLCMLIGPALVKGIEVWHYCHQGYSSLVIIGRLTVTVIASDIVISIAKSFLDSQLQGMTYA